MKKLLALLLAASLALTMAACGGEAASSGDTAGSTDTAVASAAEPYAVALDNGKTVTINGEANAAIAALGTQIDYMEAPSCVHEGSDKVYTYDGYTVTTSPDGKGGEYVAELALTSDVVALDNGLYIGCALADVKKAYGEDFTESFGVYKYELAGATLSIIAEGDTVTGITFASAAAH